MECGRAASRGRWDKGVLDPLDEDEDFFIAMAEEIYRQIRTVGLLFMVPVVVGAWPIAGFFLGDFLQQRFAWPAYSNLMFAALGLMAGVLEISMIFKVLPKDKKPDNGKIS